MGAATYIVAITIFLEEEEFKASEKLEEAEDNQDKDEYSKHGIVLRYARPFFKRYFLPVVQGFKNKKKYKDRYKKPLASAGLSDLLTPEEFFSFKLSLIIGFPIVFIAVRWFIEATWPLSMSFVTAGIGFFYPDIWIKGKIKERQKHLILNMPFCVDMLALSVEAGLDFVAAMTKVIEKAKKSPLTTEFEILIKEIKIGASRAEALRNMAWRCDLVQISSFCATLIAADSVGASIGPILKALSGEIRQKRSSEIEKTGATAATKILIPMMVFIIPAVVIMIFTPMLLSGFS